MWLGIRDLVRSYVLDPRVDYSYGQREVLRAASRRYGGEAILLGTLTLGPSGYWTLEAGLDRAGKTERWRIAEVTFDMALRDAIDRATRALR